MSWSPLTGQGQVSDLPAIHQVLGRAWRRKGGKMRCSARMSWPTKRPEDRGRGARQLQWHVPRQLLLTNRSTPSSRLAIERQNEVEGTGIDVSECAKRKFAARPGVLFLFESCSLHGFRGLASDLELG